MKARPHDPSRLDIARFAADGAELSGAWAAQGLPRLAELQVAPVDMALDPVTWSVRGEHRAVEGARPQTWLHVRARTQAWLTCQRCLHPVATPLEVVTSLQFVADEAQAEALDAESEHDVLVIPGALDLRALIEDELLLALPIVARHANCPVTLPASTGEPAPAGVADEARENPFAALAALRRGRT